MHSHFASLNLNKKEDFEQVEFVYKQFGGVPGLIAPFIRRLKNREGDFDGIIDITTLMAVHLSTLRDKEKALADSAGGYTGEVKNKSLEELLRIGK